MNYTLGEAAKATGKSKPTISRAIKSGVISATKNNNGSYSIDASELHRVFQALPESNSTETFSLHHETVNTDSMLHRENQILREQISDLKSERDAWRDQVKHQNFLLEHHENKLRKGIFSSLFMRFKK